MKEMPEPILSKDLTASDVPSKVTSWSDVIPFAATFRLTEEFPNGSHIQGLNDISRNSTVAQIRAALFVEYRRYNHFAYEPENDVLETARQSLNWIRERLNTEQ